MRRRYHYLMWKLYQNAAKAYHTMFGNDDHYIMLHLTAIEHQYRYTGFWRNHGTVLYHY